ncbi:MAG: M48 family metallopeptidase, partial [Thermoanaerobaculia bacterium]|nr:M48 family metallopeptidase [Thermoanaerobaculia bacterium]
GGARWALHAADEPLLFAYMARLARLVGARRPDRIVVDTRVNASAGHLNLLSLRRGRLQLTLGLPLVTSLSLRELTGVLAHEFGHFRQGLGSRIALVVRGLNRWFFRAALERDALDRQLANLLEDDSVPSLLRLPFALAALCIEGCRWVPYLELRIGAGLSAFWNRQMEYDADRWEALLGGGPAFAETMLKLRVLEVASGQAHGDLTVTYREGRLSDDLPGLIASHAAAMPHEIVSRVRNEMLSHRTERGESHPSDLDRIDRVRDLGAGLFRNDAPASVLFSSLPRLCRSATLHYYRQEQGLDVTAKNLVPNESSGPGGSPPPEGGDARSRFFQGVAGGSRLFFLDYGSVPQVPENARYHLKRLRERVLELAPRGRAARRNLDLAFDLRMRATAASRLAAAGVPFRASAFNLPGASEQALEQARGRAEKLETGALPATLEIEKILRQRMLLALALTRDEEIGAALGGEGPLRSASSLVGALAALQRVKADFEDLNLNLTALEPVLAFLRAPGAHAEVLTEGALQLLADLERAMQDLRRKVSPDRYPWGHVDKEMTMALYLVPEVPPAGQWLRLRDMGHEVRIRYGDTHDRLVSELAALAESVEEAAGLARLRPHDPARARDGRAG